MRYFALLSLLLLPLSLSACGFSPVYGDYSNSAQNQESSGVLSRINIAPLKDRDGQFLRNALIDRFYQEGYPQNPLYQLTLTPLIETESNFDITVESETTRRQLKISTSLDLIDLETGEVVIRQNLTSISSYNVIESEFATRVSEQSVREAILRDLARQVEQRITLHLNR